MPFGRVIGLALALACALLVGACSEEDTEPAVAAGPPERLVWESGAGLFGWTKIRWDASRRVLVHTSFDAPRQKQTRTEIRPTSAQWERFWRAVDEAGVWDWKRRYDEPGPAPFDAGSWELNLRLDGREVTSDGIAAQPASFERFTAALAALVGGRRV